jgi:hypothetical protein
MLPELVYESEIIEKTKENTKKRHGEVGRIFVMWWEELLYLPLYIIDLIIFPFSWAYDVKNRTHKKNRVIELITWPFIEVAGVVFCLVVAVALTVPALVCGAIIYVIRDQNRSTENVPPAEEEEQQSDVDITEVVPNKQAETNEVTDGTPGALSKAEAVGMRSDALRSNQPRC